MYKNPIENMTFKQFLNVVELNKSEYISVLRYSISKPTVFLKRTVDSIKINAYNTKVLDLFGANMDIQFILDVYSCAHYVINYISKSRGEMSKLLNDIYAQVSRGNFTLAEKLRHLGNEFLNCSEFSAQECAYYILSIPISQCSRNTVFINTNLPEDRIRVFKTKKELAKLADDSEDVFVSSSLENYINRPDELENVCLADFVALYSKSKRKSKKLDESDDDYCIDQEDDEDDDFENDDSFPPTKRRKNNEPQYVLRKRPRIIRYVKYNREIDEINYYCREHLMLFYPWRKEAQNLIDVNVKELCFEYQDIILRNKAKYVYQYNTNINEDLELAIEELIRDDNERQKGIICEDAPILEEVYDRNVPEYEILNDRTDEGDIATDLGHRTSNAISSSKSRFSVSNKMADDEYFQIMQKLNVNQRKIVLEILHSAKTEQNLMILGSAGVGKSVTIEAIYQSLLRYYFQEKDYDSTSTYVLKVTFTGKAALNIRGLTLHTAFNLAPNQLGKLNSLSASQQNTLYSQLRKLKFILLDEISMIGGRLLSHVDTRLRTLFNKSQHYGGISLIAFGDFNQLDPNLNIRTSCSNDSNERRRRSFDEFRSRFLVQKDLDTRHSRSSL